MPTFHENTHSTGSFHHWAGFWIQCILYKRWVIYGELWRLIFFFFFFISCWLFTCFCCCCCCVPKTHLTYSADFQKCPGWERRRFRFGNFSSKSTSLEKLGRSSCLNAQQRSRMSWETQVGKNQTPKTVRPNQATAFQSKTLVAAWNNAFLQTQTDK